MPRPKSYKEGEAIEFKRDTDYGREWESGTYMHAVIDSKGWHWVEAAAAFKDKYLVPARRLRAKVNRD